MNERIVRTDWELPVELTDRQTQEANQSHPFTLVFGKLNIVNCFDPSQWEGVKYPPGLQ